jgi:hypothetical protein
MLLTNGLVLSTLGKSASKQDGMRKAPAMPKPKSLLISVTAN